MTARWRPGAAWTLALSALVAACATSRIGASRIEGGMLYSPKGYALRLPPSGWRVASDGSADLELRRDAPPGGMLADATCEGRDRGRPLPVLVRHLTFGLTERVTVESDRRTVGGRPAEHRVVRGIADGAPVLVEAVVVDGERCIHDFLYVAPVAHFEEGRREFQALIESLSEWTR
jgi:hypothetical protein